MSWATTKPTRRFNRHVIVAAMPDCYRPMSQYQPAAQEKGPIRLSASFPSLQYRTGNASSERMPTLILARSASEGRPFVTVPFACAAGW
jgi:hypothetical protein